MNKKIESWTTFVHMKPLIEDAVLQHLRKIYRTEGISNKLTALVQCIVYDIQLKHPRYFPWRVALSPYTVFVSEIMLQQTQAERVAAIFPRFIHAFPNFYALAEEPFKDVLQLWKGLGYNRRALYLHRSAQIIASEYEGNLPADLNKLCQLPGVGTSTAAAICAFAFNLPVVFLETNIRAVFIYLFFDSTSRISDKNLLPFVDACLDRSAPTRWYNALMDAGCAIKKFYKNPTRKSVTYKRQSKFEGSWRQLRGKILEIIISKGTISKDALVNLLPFPHHYVHRCLCELESENFLIRDENGNYCISS